MTLCSPPLLRFYSSSGGTVVNPDRAVALSAISSVITLDPLRATPPCALFFSSKDSKSRFRFIAIRSIPTNFVILLSYLFS